MPTNKILVLDKALSILSYFYINSELSVKELEKLTGVNRTTIFKSLQSFIDWGYLEQDPISKRYKASLKILGMAGILLQRIDVIKIARPYLLSLRDETEETTIVTVLNDFDILVADWEPSFHDAHINSSVGKRVPAYCSGAGKAILANLPAGEIEDLLEKHKLKKCTKNTITDKKKFINELKLIYHAVSLGSTESLICIPYLTTMLYLPPEQRTMFGVNLNTVRLSAGIEHTDKLIEDLKSALLAI
ncbi:MAG: PLP-dependent transferase [Spirochaetales bacterium]|nr:PLP-dependent transferase [Spirochaetales bacterium]